MFLSTNRRIINICMMKKKKKKMMMMMIEDLENHFSCLKLLK